MRKLALLSALSSVSLATAGQVRTLHEFLCFTRAYPDTAEVLAEVERWLSGFGHRRDVRRVRHWLVNSGIAGTDILYPFGRLTARWLAQTWGDRLRVQWDRVEDDGPLSRLLILFALDAEVPGLDEAPLAAREWLRSPPPQATAPMRSHLASAVEGLPAPERIRDRLYEELGLTLPAAGWSGDAEPHASAVRGRATSRFQSLPLRRRAAGLARRGAATAACHPRGRATRRGPPDRSRARGHGHARARPRRLRLGRPRATSGWWSAATACSSPASARSRSGASCSSPSTASSR